MHPVSTATEIAGSEILGPAAAKQPAWMWVAVVLLLAVVFVFGNWPAVSGRAAGIWDAESFFAPSFTLVADHARTGRIVLWNPWQSGGSPDFAEPELGSASPLTIVMGALVGGTESGYRAYWLLVWFLGPLGVVMLARHFEAPPWAAAVVALGFAFCGFYTGHAEHMSSLYSFSFIPWFLWRLDTAMTQQRLRPAVETGALWGLSALAGYPELVIVSAGFIFLWVVGRIIAPPAAMDAQPSSGVRNRILHGLSVIILVACVGSVVLAPSYFAFFSEAGTGYSDRVGPRARAEAIGAGPIQPGALLTFSNPYLTNLKMYKNPGFWKESDVSETNIYVGALITILSLLAVALEPKSRWRWWLLVTGMFFGACAVGNHLPVRAWLYDYVPPTRYFRGPALIRAYVIVCAVVLAIFGAKDLDRAIRATAQRTWKYFTATSVIVAACAIAAYFYVLSTVKNVGPWVHRADKHLAWVWLGSVGLAVLFLCVRRARKLLPLLLIMLAVVDASLTMRVARLTVFSNGHSRITWTWIDAHHNPDLVLTKGLKREVHPLSWIGIVKQNSNVPLKVPTMFKNYDTLWNRFLTDYQAHAPLVDMCTGSDRIWFSGNVLTLPPTDTFYKAFVDRSDSLGAPVLIVHPPREMAMIRQRNVSTPSDAQDVNAISHLGAAQRISTHVVRYTPNQLDLSLVAPQDGWVLVTDRWSRGWRAEVNGIGVPVFGADFIFRAVPVKSGSNIIRFSYRPAGWPLLTILSWGTLAAVVAPYGLGVIRKQWWVRSPAKV